MQENQPSQQKAFIVFDLETTGFKPEAGDEILEIGAEKLINREVVDTFHALVRPMKPIPASSTDIHGITDAIVAKDGKDLKETLKQFLGFIGDAVLVGHNVNFDMSFVNAYSESLGLLKPQNQLLDTCEIARRQIILPSYRLERVAQYFDIVNPQAHRSMADVEVTRKVFLKLLDRALASKRKTS